MPTRAWAGPTAALLLCAACAAPPQIAKPETRGATAVVERDGVTLTAEVLDQDETKRLLQADADRHPLLPVVFRVDNHTDGPLKLERERFTLRIDGAREVVPALPGRAASLLRNSAGSAGWSMAGYLVLGALAAPGINAAERREDAAVEANRAAFFTEAVVAPGATVTGYLVFESPGDRDEATQLELRLATDGFSEPLVLLVPNPYAD